MSPQSNYVDIVFRVYDGEVIALMPHEKADISGRLCTCYVHLGQHGAADYSHVITHSRPAGRDEYAPLLAELESIGYGVIVKVRAGRRVGRETNVWQAITA